MRFDTVRSVLKTLFMILVILTLLMPLSSSLAQDNSDALEITDLDVKDGYAREVSQGATTTYRWTVKNVYQYNRTVVVHIDMDIDVRDSGSTWNITLEPQGPVTLPEIGDAETFTLTVVAPSNVEEGSADVTLTFTVELEQSGAQLEPVEERTAFTSLTPIDEKVKILDIFDNPLPEPLDNEWGVFILTVLFWLGLSFLVILILDPFVKSFAKKTKTELDDIILRIVRTPVLVLIFLFGVVDSLTILDAHIPGSVLGAVNSIWGAVAVLILFYVAYKLFKDILVYYGELIAKKTSSNIDDVIVPIVEKIGVVIIALVGLGYLLGYLNIDLTVFVAGGVVISMVIAFAAQETLSNFFSGIFILTDRPFREGDTIILPDGDWYEVRNIGLRSTRLFRYNDASLISIPNNQLAGDKIVNFSNPEDKTRIRLTFGVAYGTHPQKVKDILLNVAKANPDIIQDEEGMEPFVKFNEMADSSLNFLLQVHVKDRAVRWDTVDYLNTEVYRRFNEEKIEIPFPQRTVWIKREKKEEGEKDA